MKHPSLAVVVYKTPWKSVDVVCFVGDLGRGGPTKQAREYLKNNELKNEDGGFEIIQAYWHNALEDKNGNRYEPLIREV